jgi:hypothetical protein
MTCALPPKPSTTTIVHRQKYRPARIVVRVAGDAQPLFLIPVGRVPEGCAKTAREYWEAAWSHVWLSLLDVPDHKATFDLVVEEATAPLPREIAEDPELLECFFRPVVCKAGLPLGRLLGAVVRYHQRTRPADTPRQRQVLGVAQGDGPLALPGQCAHRETDRPH